MLAGVSAGRAPSTDKGASEFLTTVAARMPFYCRAKVAKAADAESKDDENSEQCLWGARAAEQLWRELKTKKDVTLAELETVERFQWLLTSRSQDALAKKTEELAKQAKTVASKPPPCHSEKAASSSKTPTVGQLAKQKKRLSAPGAETSTAKKGKVAVPDASAAADAMFA
eukprot:4414535-Amphidinium_carterae.1